MKIFDLSFGCVGVSSVWKKVFEGTGLDYAVYEWEEVNTTEKRRVLTERLEESCGCGRTLVIYSTHGMDQEFEAYFAAMAGELLLLPVGSGALMLNHCNVEAEHVAKFNRYIIYGGDKNLKNAVTYLRKYILGDTQEEPEELEEMPFDGIYNPENEKAVYRSLEEYLEHTSERYDTYVGILSHRHSWMNDGLQAEKRIAKALQNRGIGVIAVFSSGEKSELIQSYEFEEIIEHYYSMEGKSVISALINFQLHLIKAEHGLSIAENSVRLFSNLDVPVFHPISSYMLTTEEWKEKDHPLAEEMQASYLNPEMAGMTEPVLVALRDAQTREVYPLEQNIDYFVQRVKKWCGLKQKENQEKKIVIMLHNSVCVGVEATIGKAYGMDAFESVVKTLKRLQREGYRVNNIPENGKALKNLIMEKKAFSDFRWTSVEDICSSGGCLYQMDLPEYQTYFSEFARQMQNSLLESWGEAPGEGMVLGSKLIITGIDFGNILVMVQPKRGCYGAKCTGEVCRILHDPLCPPTHQYIATYRYISRVFRADAVIHFGTDGSLEYLPGKSSGLDRESWTYAVLDQLPNIYPYHPGVTSEAMIAKRRTNAVLVSYYPASSFGIDKKNMELLGKINDYMQALELFNGQENVLKEEIRNLLEERKEFDTLMDTADSFEEGLQMVRSAVLKCAEGAKLLTSHVFGEIPDEEECLNYICEVLFADEVFPRSEGETDGEYRIRIRGMIEEKITEIRSLLVNADTRDGVKTLEKLDVIAKTIFELYGGILQTEQELENLVHLLSGGYIPSGEGGMPDENGRKVLPTGRNFYMMNMDKIPTETAYDRGVLLAEQLLEAYQKEEGGYPKKIAMNMISIDIARTHGEQLSQFMYLMGVRPLWDKLGRVTGLEVIPVSELGRPRMDVTLRISGVMRDTWPEAVNLMDDVVLLVSQLEESNEENYIRANIHEMEQECGELGARAKTIRIFGDPPGTFGAGIDLALKASSWEDDKDLARYFIQASSFAYGNGLNGRKSVREFIENAKKVDLTCDTSSSRRMDTLSCGFGLQVQGGFKLVAETIGGKKIRQYQSSNEPHAKIQTKTLRESVQSDIDDTLLNVIWREKMKEKEYDGASEMMHRVQSVFDAKCTSECVEDETLDQLTEEYINNEEMRNWLIENNRFAAEEIARRLLELCSRGKWKPNEQVLERLRSSYLMIEGDMEDGVTGNGEIQGGSIEIIKEDQVEIWKKNLAEIDEYLRMSGNNK